MKTKTRPKPMGLFLESIADYNTGALDYLFKGVDALSLSGIYPFLNFTELVSFATGAAYVRSEEMDAFKRIASRSRPFLIDYVMLASSIRVPDFEKSATELFVGRAQELTSSLSKSPEERFPAEFAYAIKLGKMNPFNPDTLRARVNKFKKNRPARAEALEATLISTPTFYVHVECDEEKAEAIAKYGAANVKVYPWSVELNSRQPLSWQDTPLNTRCARHIAKEMSKYSDKYRI